MMVVNMAISLFASMENESNQAVGATSAAASNRSQ